MPTVSQRLAAFLTYLWLSLEVVFARLLPQQRVKPEDLSGHQIIITGVSLRSIGYETALKLLRSSASLVICARNTGEANEAREQLLKHVPKASIEVVELDVSSLGSVKTFADAWERRPNKTIDALLCNAGICTYHKSQSVDGFELVYATNFLGHFALSLRLLPFMAPSGRIIHTSSFASFSARDLTPHTLNSNDLLAKFEDGGRIPGDVVWQLYARSKADQAILAVEMARRLKASGSGVQTMAVYPGLSRTQIWDREPVDVRKLVATVARHGVSIEQASCTLTWAASNPKLARGYNGSFLHRNLRLGLPTWITDEANGAAFFAQWLLDSDLTFPL